MVDSSLRWALSLVAAVAVALAACTPAPAQPSAPAPATEAAPEAKPPAAKAEPAPPAAAPKQPAAQAKQPAAEAPQTTAGPPRNPNAKVGGTLIFAASRDLLHANPFVQTQSVGKYTKQSMYEALLNTDLEGNLHGAVAESWEISPDATAFTFKIRPAKFHNGQDVTADDVVWSFEFVMNPENGAIGYNHTRVINRVEKVDDQTVRVTLNGPSVPFLISMAEIGVVPIVPAGSLQLGERDIETPPPGTGPFKFVEYVPNTRTVVDRFEDYWGGAPYVDRIVFQVIPDANVRFVALRAGDVHAAERVPADWAPRVLAGEVPGIQIYQPRNSGSRAMLFNVQSPVFSDVRLREAAFLAVDREQYLDELFAGLGTPLDVLMPPGSRWHRLATEALPPRRHDPDRARQLMQEAGYQGQEVELHGERNRANDAESLQRMLQEVGFNVRVVITEGAVHEELEAHGQFDLIVTSGGLEADPVIGLAGNWMCEEGPLRADNNAGYCNPEVDALFEELAIVPEQARREQIWQELVQKVYQDYVQAYLGTEPRFFAWRDELKDWQPEDGGAYISALEGFQIAWLDQ